ncbi:MAG: FprA family A-type flavoprotein, partial [Cetobacterium sp.]
MHYHAPITEKVFWIGTNDRKTERFENYLPLPQGVAYNSYLINDEKTCIIDTVDFSTAGLF